MGYVMAFILGVLSATLINGNIDKNSTAIYEHLSMGEYVCNKNGGLKSFDLFYNFTCNDGAEFYVPADKVGKQ